jgi:hypothetical protein
LLPKLRTAITLGALTLLLLAGLVWGWSRLTQPLPSLSGESEAGPAEACTVRKVAQGERLRPPAVTVSVFNASATDGLATRTLKQLEARGFAAGTTGNAPTGTRVDAVQIWADDPGNPAVQLVRAQLGKSVKVVSPDRDPIAAGVAVVVGDDFTRVVKGIGSVVAEADAEICGPAETPAGEVPAG